jgi:hypothetical protein
MNSFSKVFGSGLMLRTMPYSSMATSIGTPLTCITLIGSCRIGQFNWCHWVNSRQRSGFCSCAIPRTTSFPLWTHSCTCVFQAGTARRQPIHHEAKWTSRTFRPRNCDSDTGLLSAILGKVKSGCNRPTCGE